MLRRHAFLSLALPAFLLLTAGVSEGEDPAKDALASGLAKIRELREHREGAAAETEARRLLSVAEESFGEASLPYVQVLDELVRTRVDAGKLTEDTLSLAWKAVDRRSELEGHESLSLLTPLDDLALLLHVASKLDSAKSIYQWSLLVRQEHFGAESPEAAVSIAGLGNVEADLGNTAEGLKLLRKSVDILERHYGRLDPKVATGGLFRLANLLFDLEDYSAAKKIWQRTLKIYQLPEFRDDTQVSRSLHNLGLVYHRLGRIPEAFDYLQRGLKMRLREDSPGEKPFGPFPSSYAALAELKQDVGDFSGAREDYETARSAIKSWMGEDSFRYAENLSSLALLLEASGEWEEAEKLQTEALDIRLRKLGTKEDPRVARVLSRLGSLQLKLGKPEEAEKNLKSALEIQLKIRAPSHSEVAATLIGLARLAEVQGRGDEAKELLVRSLSDLGTEHGASLELVVPLERLATIARRESRTEEAGNWVDRGLRVVEAALGPRSPRAVNLLTEKALLLAEDRKTEEALRTALQAEDLRREHLRATISSFPERQALAFVGSRSIPRDLALSILEGLGGGSKGRWAAKVWDRVIRSRALVFDSVGYRQRLLRAGNDPSLQDSVSQLAAQRRRLAALLVRGPGRLPAERYQDILASARRGASEAERTLARASRPFFRELQSRDIGFEDVARALPAGSALVAILLFRHYELPKTSSDEGASDHYLAFVLRAGKVGPGVVSLGPAHDIDRAVREWREALETEWSGSGSGESLERSGRRLRELIWDPLVPHLQGIERLFMVADGSLNLVNPAALPAAGQGYLIEEGPILHFLTAERDLAVRESDPEKGQGLLALGGVQFYSRQALAAKGGSSGSGLDSALTRGWTSCESFRSRSFSPLPATAREVDEIVGIWDRAKAGGKTMGAHAELTGAAASEAAFKRLAPGRQVLHLATHGFFLDGRCSHAAAPGGRHAGAGSLDSDLLGLTGLAMAGANHRDEARPNQEDGILTAVEISALDLGGVRWAVLSACETGIGRVQAGEGVFGLRRAFALAGARTVIMSLWRVDDESTHLWMRHLYEEHFDHGVDTAKAVRLASLKVLEARRRDELSTNPVYWASFVASGDWR